MVASAAVAAAAAAAAFLLLFLTTSSSEAPSSSAAARGRGRSSCCSDGQRSSCALVYVRLRVWRRAEERQRFRSHTQIGSPSAQGRRGRRRPTAPAAEGTQARDALRRARSGHSAKFTRICAFVPVRICRRHRRNRLRGKLEREREREGTHSLTSLFNGRLLLICSRSKPRARTERTIASFQFSQMQIESSPAPRISHCAPGRNDPINGTFRS